MSPCFFRAETIRRTSPFQPCPRMILPAELSKDQLFNVPTSYTDNYQYILNVNPQVVQERTKIYTQFKAG